jgi:hypothetical protein
MIPVTTNNLLLGQRTGNRRMATENDVIALLKAVYPKAARYFIYPPDEGIPLKSSDIRNKWRAGFIDSAASPRHCYIECASSLPKLFKFIQDYAEDEWKEGLAHRNKDLGGRF